MRARDKAGRQVISSLARMALGLVSIEVRGKVLNKVRRAVRALESRPPGLPQGRDMPLTHQDVEHQQRQIREAAKKR